MSHTTVAEPRCSGPEEVGSSRGCWNNLPKRGSRYSCGDTCIRAVKLSIFIKEGEGLRDGDGVGKSRLTRSLSFVRSRTMIFRILCKVSAIKQLERFRKFFIALVATRSMFRNL